MYYIKSQSLPLFRAFQLVYGKVGYVPYLAFVAIPSFIQGISTKAKADVPRVGSGRNPFLYSGHFNLKAELHGQPPLIVAIPSFIQGISTH